MSRFGAIPVDAPQPGRSRFGAVPVDDQPAPERAADAPRSPVAEAAPARVPNLADALIDQGIRAGDSAPPAEMPPLDPAYTAPAPQLPFMPNITALLVQRGVNLLGQNVTAAGNLPNRAADFIEGTNLPGAAQLVEPIRMASQPIRDLGEMLTSVTGPGVARYTNEFSRAWSEKDIPSLLSSAPGAIAEVTAQSAPDMAEIAYGFPAYVLARAEELNAERIRNGGDDTLMGYTQSLSSAAMSAALDKVGLEGLIKGMAPGPGAILNFLKSVLTEGVTEAAQVVPEYLGTRVGTDKPVDLGEMGQQAAIEGVLGAGAGGLITGPVLAGNELASNLADRQIDRELKAAAEGQALEQLDPSNAGLVRYGEPAAPPELADVLRRHTVATTPRVDAQMNAADQIIAGGQYDPPPATVEPTSVDLGISQSSAPEAAEPVTPLPPLPQAGQVAAPPAQEATAQTGLPTEAQVTEEVRNNDWMRISPEGTPVALEAQYDPVDDEVIYSIFSDDDPDVEEETFTSYAEAVARYQQLMARGETAAPAQAAPEPEPVVDTAPKKWQLTAISTRPQPVRKQGKSVWGYNAKYPDDAIKLHIVGTSGTYTVEDFYGNEIAPVRFGSLDDAEAFVKAAAQNVIGEDIPSARGRSFEKSRVVFDPEFVKSWSQPVTGTYRGPMKWTPAQRGFAKGSSEWFKAEDADIWTNGHILDLNNADFYAKNVKGDAPGRRVNKEGIEKILGKLRRGTTALSDPFEIQPHQGSATRSVGFTREDGEITYADRKYVDHFHELYKGNVDFRQEGGPLGMIGVYQNGELVGALMPIRPPESYAQVTEAKKATRGKQTAGVPSATSAPEIEPIVPNEDFSNVPNPVNATDLPEDVDPRTVMVLIACSSAKKSVEGAAYQVYDGPFWQDLRKNIGQIPWANVWVASGKHGIIDADARIEPYEQLLTEEAARKLILQTNEDAAEEVRRGIKDSEAGLVVEPMFDTVIMQGGELYRHVWHAYVTQMQAAGLIAKDATVVEALGNPGARADFNKYLRQANGEEVGNESVPPAGSQPAAEPKSEPAIPSGESVMTLDQFREANRGTFPDFFSYTRSQLADKTMAELKPLLKSIGYRQSMNKAEAVQALIDFGAAVKKIEDASRDDYRWRFTKQDTLKVLARLVTELKKYGEPTYKPGAALEDRRRNLLNWVDKARARLETDLRKRHQEAAKKAIIGLIEKNKGLTRGQMMQWGMALGNEPWIRETALSYYDFHKIDPPEWLVPKRPAAKPAATPAQPAPKEPRKNRWSRVDSGGWDGNRWKVTVQGPQYDGATPEESRFEARLDITLKDGREINLGGGTAKRFSDARRGLIEQINDYILAAHPPQELHEKLLEIGQMIARQVGDFDNPQNTPSSLPPILRETSEGDTRIPRGGLSPQAHKVSFTHRPSLFRIAFEDAGVDPSEASLMRVEKQIEILTKLYKDRFGIKVVQKPGARARETIDQLLDGYRNIRFMLNVLGLPATGASLDGTLTLRLEKFKGQYLGAYAPATRTIYLPGRSNSFAHEWFHALDHWLMTKVMPDVPQDLWSRQIRSEGIDAPAGSLEEAFVKLMNAVFYKNPDLEGLDPQKAANLISRMMRGQWVHAPKAMPGSDYAKNAAAFGDPSYWASAPEMFARAFEAYVAYKLESEAVFYSGSRGSNEMITKGDKAYLSDADKRLRMTFPKSQERMRIFEAFDDLFDQIRARQILGIAERAEKPSDLTAINPAQWDMYVPDPASKSVWQSEKAAARDAIDWIVGAPKRWKEMPAAERMSHLVGYNVRYLTWSVRSRMRSIIRNAPEAARPALRKLMDDVTEDVGTGRYAPETIERESARRFMQAMNRVDNILNANGLTQMVRKGDKDGLRMLRDLLISEDVPSAPGPMKKAAAALRRLLDEEWYNNIADGVELGYTRNGYLPRMLNYERVANGKSGDGKGFVEKASEVYDVMFDSDVDEDFSLEAYAALLKKVRQTNKALAAGYEGDLKALQKLVRKLRKLTAQLKTSDDPDVVQGKIDELLEEIEPLWQAVRDAAKPAWSFTQADAWHQEILDGSDFDYDIPNPAGKYTRSRSLPPEADKILEDFYINDPIEAIQAYFASSTRRIAYMKRAFPMGENGRRYNRWEALREEARRAGADPTAVQDMKQMMSAMTGRQGSGMPSMADRGLSVLMALGTMNLLSRAWMSSVPEPMAAIGATHDVVEPFRILAYMIGDLVKTGGAQDRRMIAQTIGLVANPEVDMLNQTRVSGEALTGRWRALMSRYFRMTLLTGLTMAQRRATVGSAWLYARALAESLKAKEMEAKTRAELNEMGIPPHLQEDFADWVLQHERMPNYAEMQSEAGQLLGLLMRRVSQRIILEPTKGDRPQFTQTSWGRVINGITSYTQTFYEMTTKRLIKQLDRDIHLDTSGAERALTIASAAGLIVMTFGGIYLGQLLMTTLREALFNQDEWEKRKLDGTLASWLMEKAAWRMGLGGPLDNVLQTARGIIFQRDLTSIMAGAQIGTLLSAIGSIMTPVLGTNSPNTNNAEHNAVRGIYQAMVQPALLYALTSIGGGPVTGLLLGGAMGALSSPEAGKEFADIFVGEKDSTVAAKAKGDRPPQLPKMPTPKGMPKLPAN